MPSTRPELFVMPITAPLFFDSYLFFLVFGVLTLVGGIMGYVKAKSVASLVAGGVCGVLLIVGALLIVRSSWQIGAALDLLVSLALLGRFGPALFRGKLNPAAYLVPLALVGVVLTLMLLLGGGHP